mgnify:CR=1 FL=1
MPGDEGVCGKTQEAESGGSVLLVGRACRVGGVLGMAGSSARALPGVPFDEDYLQTQLDDVTINVASHKYFSGDVTLTEGITVGLNKIIKAGKVIVIINHDTKKDIYQEIVNGDAHHTQVPAIYIKQFPQVNYYVTKNLIG